ncbi:MAG: hypothetical protein A2920_00325 [Candidatus Zambryskibacteria bacterium RIFCSPLOWO2_01_FULL_43_17]|uniref:Uncharacterized protein n=1 Tax=Candidatus Zambryskibacteria bacterium RIFCSPLOWO2_01_FULL_43_17 TaxID=1802760 RepID=A0A1G2TZZ4_9BACT|nr:MAG: hypothetical protein A2920_00325 [Candidatus Zambryskibacteria bacterium RIFCSPLOWO2_01_FULL_43_17]
MTKSTKFISLLLVLIALAVSWFVVRERLDLGNKSEDEKLTPAIVVERKPILYRSEIYGFSFSYPEGYELTVESPEKISVGRKNIRGIETLVEISLVKSGDDTGIQSFEEFVLDGSRELCAINHALLSLSCTRIDDIVRIAPFMSDAGTNGQVFYLKAEVKENTTGKTLGKRRGPFYTFNTSPSTPNEMSFVAIYNPVVLDAEDANEDLIESIAKSFVYRP